MNLKKKTSRLKAKRCNHDDTSSSNLFSDFLSHHYHYRLTMDNGQKTKMNIPMLKKKLLSHIIHQYKNIDD